MIPLLKETKILDLQLSEDPITNYILLNVLPIVKVVKKMHWELVFIPKNLQFARLLFTIDPQPLSEESSELVLCPALMHIIQEIRKF